VPLPEQYSAAQELTLSFVYNVIQPIRDEWSKVSLDASVDTSSQRGDLVQFLQDVWDLARSVPLASPRLQNALPRDLQGVNTVKKEGIRGYYQRITTKPLAELEATGRCLTHIRGTPQSAIPQAGRGAIATTALSKGQTITGTPLLFMPNSRALELYHGDWLDKSTPPNGNKLFGYQIMYNYCWNHPESTMLLCPYGAIVNYINHGRNTTRRNYNESSRDAFVSNLEANVEWRWPANGDMYHDASWLNRTVREFGWYNPSPGLFIDLVATRDIAPGEEILMDYGRRWEDAWIQHVEEFFSVDRSGWSHQRSALDLNAHPQDSQIRTVAEQSTNPYPSNVDLRCHGFVSDMTRSVLAVENVDRLWDTKMRGLPCRVTDRVKTESNQTSYTLEFDLEDYTYTRTGVWRPYLKFFDRPYSTNVHLERAFRQPIGFPDHLFPGPWRNLKQ
jgi:hypothetical protein